MDVSAILISALILGSVGLVFGGLIAFANRTFKVYEDPRISGTVEFLPGNNCGACGFPGCQGFAEGLVQGKAEPSGCSVLGPEGVADVASYLGVDAGEKKKVVARLLCAGGTDVALQKAAYLGLPTCGAAAAVSGGGKGCPWGCLSLADCETACGFDAIQMSETGLPVVDPVKCTACGDCVEACPKDLFELMPIEQHLIVQCKNLLEGESAEELCKVACTGCGRCAADAKDGLIEIVDGLAVINYDKNDLAGVEAIGRCPTNAIVWVTESQFENLSLASLARSIRA
ncbi:MAG: RnfABCDGE type electron transport complex subunit B [Planctomycetota bacterium]